MGMALLLTSTREDYPYKSVTIGNSTSAFSCLGYAASYAAGCTWSGAKDQCLLHLSGCRASSGDKVEAKWTIAQWLAAPTDSATRSAASQSGRAQASWRMLRRALGADPGACCDWHS